MDSESLKAFALQKYLTAIEKDKFSSIINNNINNNNTINPPITVSNLKELQKEVKPPDLTSKDVINNNVIVNSPTLKKVISKTLNKTIVEDDLKVDLPFQIHPQDTSGSSDFCDSFLFDTNMFLEFIYETILDRHCPLCEQEKSICLKVPLFSLFILILI